MIGLDTNVLIYAVDAADTPKHIRASEIVSAVSRVESAIPVQVLAEFITVARRKVHAFEDALAYVKRIRSTFTVVAADIEVYDSAVHAMAEHKMPIWDAMLWATLDQAGCRTLLTEDFQDGQTLGGVTFLNPFNPANDAAIARLTRPRR